MFMGELEIVTFNFTFLDIITIYFAYILVLHAKTLHFSNRYSLMLNLMFLKYITIQKFPMPFEYLQFLVSDEEAK